ncbi:MAG: DNA mismatch repair protein MutS [Culicoidibacterales bacterium]
MDALTVDVTLFTPMMQQYIMKKREYPDDILFFRLGDFYEMFFQDAITVSRELEIALTARDAGYSEKIPMCGVPHHAAKNYIDRLIEKGFKVAICEQVTEAGLGKIVERDVVRVHTPGNYVIEGSDSASQSVYTYALIQQRKRVYTAYADLSIGDVFVMEFESLDDALAHAKSIQVKEIVTESDDAIASDIALISRGRILPQVRNVYQHLYINLEIEEMRRTADLLLSYFVETSKQELAHLKPIIIKSNQAQLMLDYNTKMHLELTRTQRFGSKQGSLFSQIDTTKTAIGSRKLRSYFDTPLFDRQEIVKRQHFATVLHHEYEKTEHIKDALKKVYDLERLISRIAFQNTHGRDLLQLKHTLQQVPLILEHATKIDDQEVRSFFEQIDPLAELANLLERAIDPECGLTIKEGNVIRKGFNEALDEVRAIAENANAWLAEFEQTQRERTGIKTLKIGYNRNFGYYIEISKGSVHLVDEAWGFERKQTLTTGERYITPELSQVETKILSSKDRSMQMEYQLFCELRDMIRAEYIQKVQVLAEELAFIDVMQAFAQLLEKKYIQAEIVETDDTELIDLRHAVVETLLDRGAYVPNDLHMPSKTNVHIITGPNMAGKSTYLRSIGHAIILNQIGAFIPASSARLPLFDRIFTRIGASDDALSGQSTFMVEMLEVETALSEATDKSLILFDEIGRGTATYDGIALAQAIIEYIHDKIGAKTLFATHYHELTQLEQHLTGVVNVHVSAKEEYGSLRFLHKVLPGSVDKSYGVHVASLAKLPKPVIKRASMLLDQFEAQKKNEQLDLFSSHEIDWEVEPSESDNEKKDALIAQLLEVHVESLTPLDALNILAKLVQEADDFKH